MRPRSRRMQQTYRLRRVMVATLLEQRPVCERCHALPSSEVHEVKTRARGGSILDPDNCVALCHSCHSWVSDHPQRAHETGWLRHSWEA